MRPTVRPTARWHTATVAKYDPLFALLCMDPEAPVELPFDAIATLVGELPKSAFEHRAWWANEVGGRHVQANAWLNAGREVEAVDLQARTVRFSRSTWRRRS